jgi:predicted DNA-binding antitoxin AbrB/MazE fold protein
LAAALTGVRHAVRKVFCWCSESKLLFSHAGKTKCPGAPPPFQCGSFGDNEVTTRTLQAIYENGVLRPLESLPLKEHQRVTVTVADAAERWLDREYMEKVRKDAAASGPAPSLEGIRRVLSKIPGKLCDDIRAERDSR